MHCLTFALVVALASITTVRSVDASTPPAVVLEHASEEHQGTPMFTPSLRYDAVRLREIAGFSGPIVAHVHYMSHRVTFGYTSSSHSLNDQTTEFVLPPNSFDFIGLAIGSAMVEIEIAGRVVTRIRMPLYFWESPVGKQLATQRDFVAELARRRTTQTGEPPANKAEPGDSGQAVHAPGETTACDGRYFCLGGDQ